MADSTAWSSGLLNFAFWPQATQARCRKDANGTPVASPGLAGQSLPYDVGIQYRTSGTLHSCWESDDGSSDWYLIGTATNQGALSTGVYGGVVVPVDASAAVTVKFRVLDDDSSAFTDATPSPDTPPTNPFLNRDPTISPTWITGLGQPGNGAGIESYESQLGGGQHVDIVNAWSACEQIYSGSTANFSWAQFENIGGSASANPPCGNYRNMMEYYDGSPGPVTTPVIHTMPMWAHGALGGNRECANSIANPTTGIWDQLATGTSPGGQYVDEYTRLATNYRAYILSKGRDPANSIIRFGWEMNGHWYPHAVCSQVAEFKTFWVNVVGIFRSVMPDIKFDFSPAKPYFNYVGPFWTNRGGLTPMGLCDASPDPDFVDLYSVSVHDRDPDTISFATFQQAIGNNPSDQQIDLEELRTCARSLGKLYGVGEWSTSYDRDDDPATPLVTENLCGGEGDKPRPDLFNQYFFDWAQAQGDWLSYELNLTGGCYTVWDTATFPTWGPAGRTKFFELWGSSNW
jgi:hypothetical protein